ncbi:S-layer homology domain-containing protein [bacterium]|nr:S-layer homology domain-containing protein [bacterium]
MKRFLASLLSVLMISFNFLPAFAATNLVNDIKSNYWASKEINFVVERDIMPADTKGYFNPDKSVTRVEFVHSLLKLLSNDNLNVNIQNQFTDISEYDGYFADVLRSQQLGLVYGYPDNTFKPNRVLTRAEVTSILSHITKDSATDQTILRQFTDYVAIPAWAKNEYAKTIQYGLYVNYPDSSVLNPNRDLTRAEAAVLLYKLYQKLNLVKSQYKNTASERLLAVEHLDVTDKAPCNAVKITNLRKIIMKDNVLRIAFDQKYWSKKSNAGDIVQFVFKDGVYTQEGTLVISQGSTLTAEVTNIQKPKWFNKNARVSMKFRELNVAGGKTYAIDADPFTKDRTLKEGPWMTFAKVLGWTVGLGAIGTGAGVGFAFIPNPAVIGRGIAIGTPIGCGVGLVLGFVTPGLHYKAKCGENILIILNDDTSIYNK